LRRPPAAGKGSTAPGARRWTPRDVLARALEVLKDEGLRSLVVRAASETFYRRLTLLERRFDEPLDVEVPRELEFGYLDERGVSEYEQLRPGQRSAAAARLAEGHRCFATWNDGRLVAVRWLASGTPHVEYLDLPLRLADGEVYHYDTFTAPDERRRGISAASQARLFETLREEGYRSSIRAVLPENVPAVRDAERAGYRPNGRIGYVKLGRWKRPFRTYVN
jgi:GNAT superfamily N-acetyltransferase